MRNELKWNYRFSRTGIHQSAWLTIYKRDVTKRKKALDIHLNNQYNQSLKFDCAFRLYYLLLEQSTH